MFKRSILVLMALSLAACGGKSKSNSNTAAVSPAGGNPPPIAPYGAGAYPGSVLNPDVALNGYGQWVTIGNQRFFVPSQTYASNGWVPYQNGHWMYDNQRGWTWVSADKFGWLTDHYGVWRHHRVHGWIWLPFHDMHYEAHSVSWFDQGENSAYLGWYPYNSGYSRGYSLDNRYGFDDGYWRGDRAVLELSIGGFQLGLSLVNRADACERNVRGHMVRDRTFVMSFATTAFRSPERSRFDSRFPGGNRDRAFGFVQMRSRSRPVMGEAQTVRSAGGARFLQPKEVQAEERSNRTERNRDRDRENRRVFVPPKREDVKREEPKTVEQEVRHRDLPVTTDQVIQNDDSHRRDNRRRLDIEKDGGVDTTKNDKGDDRKSQMAKGDKKNRDDENDHNDQADKKDRKDRGEHKDRKERKDRDNRDS